MAERILIEDFQKEKAIELTDGTILNLPERTADLYEEIVNVEKSRTNLSEYDYCKKVLEILFGKDEFEKIAPKGKKTNLDYLEKVQIISLELFMSEKTEIEKEEMRKQAEMFEPLTKKIQALTPVINRVK